MTIAPDLSDSIGEDEQGTTLTIEVTPGSKHPQFPTGYNPWRKAIGCHVTALPVEGKANRAVIELIARTFAVPRARVEILTGAGSSIKRVRIRGISRETVTMVLRDLL